jgi:uncharacterized membrane protein
MERTIAPSRLGIALTNAGIGVAAAVCVTVLLWRKGERAPLWMAAPTLILAAVNVDAVTALFILLALQSWKEGKPATAGIWAGLGTAFKLAPAFVLPSLAAASSPRDRLRMTTAAAVAWLATNVPYAILHPASWRLPYEFASRRQDGHGTIWAALGLSVEGTAVASMVSLGILCLAIALATNHRRITPETGSTLTLLAFLGTNKLWQPHYLLWPLPSLALTNVPILPVRALEITNLAYFVVIWRQLPPPAAPFWMWTFGVARLASLLWVAIELIRHGASGNKVRTPE